MRLLKLSNKKLLILLLFVLLIPNSSYTNEPIDIWDLENLKNKNKIEKENESIEENINKLSNIKKDISNLVLVEEEEKFISNELNLVGLYDPADNDLNLNMWELSDGEKITKLFEKIHKINLSNDAKNIYKKLLLTNAFPPEKNIDINKFISFKIKWLIKNDDLNLIRSFIIKNDKGELNSKLAKHYLDKNLSLGKIEKSCELFSIMKSIPNIDYILKYKIYCLIYTDQKEVAQLQYDLLKESGFKDDFFDVILCSHVIEHIKEDVSALKEIKRILNPNGLLIIAVPAAPAVEIPFCAVNVIVGEVVYPEPASVRVTTPTTPSPILVVAAAPAPPPPINLTPGATVYPAPGFTISTA